MRLKIPKLWCDLRTYVLTEERQTWSRNISILFQQLFSPRLREKFSASDLSFSLVTKVWKREPREGRIFEAETEGRSWEIFLRFPFLYRGNLGNSQIRQGQFFSKTVGRTIIETECFFHLSGIFVDFQRNLTKFRCGKMKIRRGKTKVRPGKTKVRRGKTKDRRGKIVLGIF